MKTKFEVGGWYQAYVSLFDEMCGLRDSGLRVIVEVLDMYVDRNYMQRERLYDNRHKQILAYNIHVTNEICLHCFGEAVEVLPPGHEMNPSFEDEFAVIEKQSPFGWAELVLFQSGFEIGVVEAKKRLSRPRKHTAEMLAEVFKSAPRELKGTKLPVIQGDGTRAIFVSFDEYRNMKRVLRRGDPDYLIEQAQKAFEIRQKKEQEKWMD